MRIRVITRAALFEECKRQHIERGYRIEDERPIPVNGLCIVHRRVREIPASDLTAGGILLQKQDFETF
jgi:hypothetical protein